MCVRGPAVPSLLLLSYKSFPPLCLAQDLTKQAAALATALLLPQTFQKSPASLFLDGASHMAAVSAKHRPRLPEQEGSKGLS